MIQGERIMSLKTNKTKFMSATDIIVNAAKNDRFHATQELTWLAGSGLHVDTYSLGLLIDAIVKAGQVNEPLHVNGKTGEVLRGFRRTLAAQAILAGEGYSPELKKAMEKLPVVVYDDLTPAEEIEIIHDKGDRKNIGRSETLAAVWRMYEQNFSEKQISNHMVYSIADYTQNRDLINNLPKEVSAREDAIKEWLHGTVGNFMLAAYDCGPRVRTAVMLADMYADGMLPKDADGKPKDINLEFGIKGIRNKVARLVKAKTADRAAGEWNGTNFTGPRFDKTFQEILDKVPATPATPATPEGPKSMTFAEIDKKKDSAKSQVAKAAMAVAQNKVVMEYPDLDSAAARWEEVSLLLIRYYERIQDTLLRDVLSALVSQKDMAELEKVLESLTQNVEVNV